MSPNAIKEKHYSALQYKARRDKTFSCVHCYAKIPIQHHIHILQYVIILNAYFTNRKD